MRIAVIDHTLCKPSKCNLECIRFCPVNRSRRVSKAIELDEEIGKPVIREGACIGCNICVKKCPFNAISIENVPDELEKNAVHRYGVNAFKLYGLPVPKPGLVTGIIGKNGTGKTTSVRILAGEIVPNLGDPSKTPDWDEVIRRFRGSELQTYFEKLANKNIRVAHKIQYVDLLPRRVRGTVKELLEKADERGILSELIREIGLSHVLDRKTTQLSGGELQKMVIAAVLSKDADTYVFDEPSSYLDVKERIRVAEIIRDFVPKNSYVIVVEHDLAVLDYLSDNISIIYGEPGVYGIVSKPYGCRAGINHFLEGYLPSENMRIRREPIRFHAGERSIEHPITPRENYVEWPSFTIKLDGFTLSANEGSIRVGEVIGIMGPNGIGKTTFVRVIAGEIGNVDVRIKGALRGEGEKANISYKPQYVSHEMFEGTVKEVLREANEQALSLGHWAYEEVVRPLRLHRLRERDVKSLSGGELQKLAIAVTLIREADFYMLDEPSAYLDVEERLSVARVIRRLTEARGVAALVVEHDVSIIDYICDRVMVFSGTPGVQGNAKPPTGLREGMNEFLKEVGVTFRRDPETGRPRVNKKGSYLDRYQKRIGEYYYIPRNGEE